MRLQLDTHSFLWFVEGNALLSLEARRLIEDMPLISVDNMFDAYGIKRLW